MNFGEFEGRLISELLSESAYVKLWNHPDDKIYLPGGETYQEVQHRLTDFFKEMYQKHADETIFITIHGMLFVILHGLMLNYPTKDLTKINKYIVRGCSLTEVDFDGKNFEIKYIGDDSHLNESEIISYK